MADLPTESSQPEGNFDNDFEKLDPFAPSPTEPVQGDDFGVSSTTAGQQDLPEEDLYSPSSEPTLISKDPDYSEAEPLVQLVDTEPTEPEAELEVKAPATVPAPSSPAKPSAPPTSTPEADQAVDKGSNCKGLVTCINRDPMANLMPFPQWNTGGLAHEDDPLLVSAGLPAAVI